jgi:hypothetical protein
MSIDPRLVKREAEVLCTVEILEQFEFILKGVVQHPGAKEVD